jgi:N-acylneuraminate cytidylyltransferase
MKKVLAVIPARGGSKGVPRKNIRPLAGKPLIGWTIEAANDATLIDRVIVSTDDLEIAEVARTLGAEVPFLRPAGLASDAASGMEPIVHAIHELQGFEYVVLLQPTSPLRNGNDIDAAIAMCTNEGAFSCVSVSEVKERPEYCYFMDKSGRISSVLPNIEQVVRRQNLPPVYCLNGAIYVAKISWFLTHKTFITEETRAWVMPRERSIDIDDTYDFELAEYEIGKGLRKSST